MTKEELSRLLTEPLAINALGLSTEVLHILASARVHQMFVDDGGGAVEQLNRLADGGAQLILAVGKEEAETVLVLGLQFSLAK